MSDIVLNKDIAGGVTNFQVVGCTIDVGTKIYAARVDALHQNTYKMLSGLGTNSNQDDGEANQGENGADMDQTGFQGGEDGEEGGDAANKKGKAKRKRMKKSSQIAENLDTITTKIRDEFKDVCILNREAKKLTGVMLQRSGYGRGSNINTERGMGSNSVGD